MTGSEVFMFIVSEHTCLEGMRLHTRMLGNISRIHIFQEDLYQMKERNEDSIKDDKRRGKVERKQGGEESSEWRKGRRE